MKNTNTYLYKHTASNYLPQVIKLYQMDILFVFKRYVNIQTVFERYVNTPTVFERYVNTQTVFERYVNTQTV